MPDFEFDEVNSDPVEEGEQYEVTIEDTGDKGDGIAKVDGLVVFVEDTEIGDEVTIEVDNVGRSAAFASVVE